MAPDPDDPPKIESILIDEDDAPGPSDKEENSESESSGAAFQVDLMGPRELVMEEDIGADLDWDLYPKSGAKRPEKSFMVGELGKFRRRLGAKLGSEKKGWTEGGCGGDAGYGGRSMEEEEI